MNSQPSIPNRRPQTFSGKAISLSHISLAGILLALGILLPVAFHALNIGGTVFLPMHFPVLLGGFFLPWGISGLVGLLCPLLSFLFTSMPPLPVLFPMMGELLVYGVCSSIAFRNWKWGIFPSLLFSMVLGRFASIFFNWLVLEIISGKTLDFSQLAWTLFVIGLPGILIQLALIPLIVKAVLKEPNLFRSWGPRRI
ncbi:MAG: ECF transporter S component [Caldiserica bacterium]|nr:ECF transporter S component [Caldisericota bacterium]MDH7562426.1 ECF transporter S component [Caldisericota bacterium]